MLDEETVVTVPPSDKPTEIVIKVVEIRGDKVREGWKAPADVTINRREVHEAIKRDAAKAAAEKK